jgi:sugar phosphate isomerase/epimerase
MRLAFYTVMTPTLVPDEAAELASALGFDGIEWRVASVGDALRAEAPSFFRNNLCTLEVRDEDAALASRLAAETGLAIPNLGTYIDVGDLDAVVRHMRFARAVGAASIRIGSAPSSDDYLDGRERTRAFVREVEEVAREQGVRAVVETHFGTVGASASQARALVDGRDPAWIGVLYDVGNMVFEGFEDYRAAVQTLGPYLHLVHVKNAVLSARAGGGAERHWAPLDTGFADIPAFIDALAACGYDGWLVIEDFSSERADRDRLSYDHAWLTAVLDERVADRARRGSAA